MLVLRSGLSNHHLIQSSNQCGPSQTLVSIRWFYWIDLSDLPELRRSTEMVGELQVTLNTCLCTHISKSCVVVRDSTVKNLYIWFSATNWLAYEESLTDEVLERNRVSLLLSYFKKTVVHSFIDLRVGLNLFATHTKNIQFEKLFLDKRKQMEVFMYWLENNHW